MLERPKMSCNEKSCSEQMLKQHRTKFESQKDLLTSTAKEIMLNVHVN